MLREFFKDYCNFLLLAKLKSKRYLKNLLLRNVRRIKNNPNFINFLSSASYALALFSCLLWAYFDHRNYEFELEPYVVLFTIIAVLTPALNSVLDRYSFAFPVVVFLGLDSITHPRPQNNTVLGPRIELREGINMLVENIHIEISERTQPEYNKNVAHGKDLILHSGTDTKLNHFSVEMKPHVMLTCVTATEEGVFVQRTSYMVSRSEFVHTSTIVHKKINDKEQDLLYSRYGYEKGNNFHEKSELIAHRLM